MAIIKSHMFFFGALRVILQVISKIAKCTAGTEGVSTIRPESVTCNCFWQFSYPN
jgi:hypothetical protein